ncbi:RNA-directed DNA polymerase, eukaryota [Tanacetum coccineum]
MTLEDAKAQMEEIKRLVELKAEKEKSEKRLKKVMTPDELRAQAKGMARYEEKRAKIFIRNILGFSEWLELHDLASKPSDSQPQTGKEKEALKSSRREEEFHLATTPQLIRIQNAIKKNSAATKEMFNKLNFVIKARNDVVEARKIVLDNLDNMASNEGVVVCKASASIEGLAECKALASNLRRIQVKDIVKEVENYLKTYSSAGMDISCLKPGELVDSDTCIWTLSHDDKFSMNSVRNHIDELSLLSLSLSTRWCKIIPRNVNIFMRRMFLDRIPNRLNLSSRGLDIDSIMCPFYNVSMESSAHIFFSDDAASAVWHLVRVWSGSIFPSFSHVASEIFGFSHGTPQRKGPRLRHLCCFLLDLMAV